MKCPHCYINYDDHDVECPMCGTRRPTSAHAFSLSNTQHMSNPSAEGTRSSSVPDTSLPTLPFRPVFKKKEKRKGSILLYVLLIFILLQIIPLIINFL